jgi:hypothetical protein
MRTTDPEPTPQRPLGEKVVKPVPNSPGWKPLEHNRQVEQDKNGNLRTQIPLPRIW